MAHVAAELARRGQADQGVQVGAVHVHTPAVAVHDLAQRLDLGLEHAVRAGVGDHHAGQVGTVLFALGLQILHVHVAVVVALGDHHLHAHHHGAGRVGAVRAGGDEADVAVRVALRRVPGLDGQQARVLALAAGVGLQAHARIAGDAGQPLAQLVVQQLVAGALLQRGKGVHVGELGPGDGDHLAGGVELHGARAQRDHAPVQRQVLVRELADVAQHGRLAVVRVEHRVRQIAAGAVQRGRDQIGRAALECGKVGQRLALAGKDAPQQLDVGAGVRLIQRDAQVDVPALAQVGAHLHGAGSY